MMVALPVSGINKFGLGPLLLIEMHRRIHGNNFGLMPKPLSWDAFDQPGYCLDAPSEMPAGACEWYDLGEDGGLPSQITVNRDE